MIPTMNLGINFNLVSHLDSPINRGEKSRKVRTLVWAGFSSPRIKMRGYSLPLVPEPHSGAIFLAPGVFVVQHI